MTIYEQEDFDKIWEPAWMKFDRKVDKLKEIRRAVEHDLKKKREEGIPTSYDLACWFRRSLGD